METNPPGGSALKKKIHKLQAHVFTVTVKIRWPTREMMQIKNLLQVK